MSSTLELHEDIVIADAVRSPLGSLRTRGAIAGLDSATLLAQTMSGLLERVHLEPTAVTRAVVAGGWRFDEIARQACAQAGILPHAVAPSAAGASRRSFLHAAARTVGPRDVVLLLASSGADRHLRPPSARRLLDAERVAARWGLDRDDLDAYAQLTRQRAREVSAMGEFGPEIVPAVAWSSRSCTVATSDETLLDEPHGDGAGLGRRPPGDDADAVRHRSPRDRYHHEGTVSVPAIGAAATILVGHDRAMELGITPRARILALAEGAGAPDTSAAGVIRTSQEVLRRIGVDLNDLDHYEVGESFSAIPLAWCREFGADIDRFNPRGGAIGLGSIGPADGLRSLATMLTALGATGGRLGLLASEGPTHGGDACLVEYMHRPCCSRDALGGLFYEGSPAVVPSHTAPAPR